MLLEMLKQDELFTNTELDIVRFIRNDITRIPDLTIGDLADLTYSSNATIIRVCKKMGCKGFSDFKMKLTKEAESQKYVKLSIDFTQPFSVYETTLDVMNSMGALYKETIDVINANIDVAELNEIIETIYSAKRIYIYGIGDTMATIKAFINKLIKLNFYAICATELHEEMTVTQTITEDDCVILCSYRGTSFDTASYLPTLIRSKAKVIGITSGKNSKVARVSHHTILVPDLEERNKIGTFYSQLGLNYILNLFYSLLYIKIAKDNKNFKPLF